MNKKTKMWLGVGVVAAAAYYFWNKSQADKTAQALEPAKKFVGSDGVFANASGTCDRNGRPNWTVRTNSNGVLVCSSPDGMQSYKVSK
jgi:putative hemolysin